jgi:hypothetical protein
MQKNYSSTNYAKILIKNLIKRKNKTKKMHLQADGFISKCIYKLVGVAPSSSTCTRK